MNQVKKILSLFILLAFYSNTNAQNIFEGNNYDTILFRANNFLIARQNKTTKVFNTKGEVFSIPKYITIAEIQANVGYQIVLGDSLKMINSFGQIDDSIKFQFGRGVCGTINRYRNKILKNKDSIFINYHTTYPYTIAINEDVNATSNDTIFISKNIDLYFLNGNKYFNFTENNDFYNGLESNVFFEKIKNGKINLLRLERVEKTIKILPILKGIKLKQEIIDRNYNINYAYFIYRKGNKYGYYPLQLITKYKSLKSFDRQFAAFVLPNGRKGWLGIDGKEYFY